MKRILFVVPDLKETNEIVRELQDSGVKEQDIHVLGESENELKQAHLHPVTIFQTAQIITLISRAVVLACVAGVLIFALFFYMFPPDMKFHPLGYAAMCVFSLGFGFWVSGLIGLETAKQFSEKYEKYIHEGHYVMMVEAPNSKEKDLRNIVKKHHPSTHTAEEEDAIKH